jgi:HlyD family secretion protein
MSLPGPAHEEEASVSSLDEPSREVIPVRVAPRRRPIALALLGLLAAGAATSWWIARRAAHVRYVTAPVTEGSLAAKVIANGSIAARVTVQVGSQVSGRIQALLVDFNSQVKHGQVLARLDPELFRAAADQARANLAAAEGSLVKARAQSQNAAKVLERTRALVAHDLVAGADVDKAESDAAAGVGNIAAAKGAVEQARAALREAQANLSYTTIVSPVDGVVISRNVDVGQTVAASLQAPTLFTIAQDLGTMQVHTNVPEADVGKLRAQMKASFTVDAFPDETWIGVVQEIRNAPQIAQNVVTYDAVVDVDNREARLRPGMTATVAFEYARRDHVRRVPNSALRYQPKREPTPASDDDRAHGGRRAIYILPLGSNAPVRRSVRLGLSDGKSTELVDGDVQVGDAVVTEERAGGGDEPKAEPKGEAKPSGGRRLPSKL